MITVDNITDELIRELMEVARREADDVTFGRCEIALGIRRNRWGKNQRGNARARCAEILNTRKAQP